jgi:CheY-like chemotaxis protein
MKECLIIDDDPDDQEIFLMCIGKVSPDIHCVTMNNGVDAISMLNIESHYTPGYIFLDVNMPKMKGTECLRLLKRMDRLKNSKIFMYSTTSDRSIVEETRELGATDFIIKPASVAVLKDKLAEIFEEAA